MATRLCDTSKSNKTAWRIDRDEAGVIITLTTRDGLQEIRVLADNAQVETKAVVSDELRGN